MNQKAIINGKEYRFIKTETDMITDRTAVLFENEHGCSFICPVEAWLENAKREEPAFKENRKDDVTAVRTVCRQFDIPLAVERSRSGNGAHDWLFFEESVTAAIARKLGSAILTTEKNQISIQRCKEFFISIPVSLSNENIIISDSEKTYYEGLCEG